MEEGEYHCRHEKGDSCGNQCDQRDPSPLGPARAAVEWSQAQLNETQHRQQQKNGTSDGSSSRGKHPEPEQSIVHFASLKVFWNKAVGEQDQELECMSYKAGVEEAGKRYHFIDYEVLNGVLPDSALSVECNIVATQRQAQEDGDGEEGIHAHNFVQCGDMNLSSMFAGPLLDRHRLGSHSPSMDPSAVPKLSASAMEMLAKDKRDGHISTYIVEVGTPFHEFWTVVEARN